VTGESLGRVQAGAHGVELLKPFGKSSIHDTARELVKNPKVRGSGPLKFLFVNTGKCPP
jgi:hypothetical protein